MTEKEINIDEILDEIRGDTRPREVREECRNCLKRSACEFTGSAYEARPGKCNRRETKYDF